MKKINLLIAAGLLASASMQAQVTTVAKVGFEPGDQKYTTESAYTPGGTYGNWVNKQDDDVWDEQSPEDRTGNGEYSFNLINADVEGASVTWNRGFVIGNLQLTENTPYRVSFWVNAEEGKSLKSSMFIGREYCDMPISTKSGVQYYYNYANSLSEGWQRISYVTFFTNKADQDGLSMNYTGKEDKYGEIPVAQGDPFPEEYGVIINCYDAGTYYLDDIKVEAGVTFNEARFGSNGIEDFVRLDFGYPTNIADLAKAEVSGIVSLDPSCVTVTVDGAPVTVNYVEGHDDGFLYVFFATEEGVTDANKVVVSFTPAADCPILYNSARRPSADTESEMQVLGFTNEEALYDESLDAQSAAFQPAYVVSSTPEDESFELVASELKSISVTFDKAMDITTTSAGIVQNGVLTDLSDNMTLSEDGKTIITTLPVLQDGEYEFMLNGLATEMATECEDVKITFAVGEDHDETISETIFKTDFDNEPTGSVPVGWRTWNEDHGFHLYGFNEDGSRMSWSWGATPGGGGCKLEQGFSGDFQKILYWGSRDKVAEYAYADFGAQVADYIDGDGNLDPDMPEGISLYLEPGKYNIRFLMAAWKGEPRFTFELKDLAGTETFAKFENQLATPTLKYREDNQDKMYNNGKWEGLKPTQQDFTVATAGYYIFRFTAAELAPWQEFSLAYVELITMPTKAAYNKQRLAAAVDLYKPVLEEEAAGAEYDGETKTALANAINYAETHKFHSASEVDEAIADMKVAAAKMQERIKNIDDFNQKIAEAELAYYGEEDPENPGEYLTEPIAGTKYANTESAKAVKEILDTYGTANPSDLSDETLAEVSPKVVSAAGKLAKVKDCTDRLTWRGYKAFQAADLFGVDGSAMLDLVTDDTPAIEQLNGRTTLALYEMLAANPIIPEEMMTVENYAADQYVVVDGEYTAMTGEEEAARGIDLTCFVDNPKMYTTATTTTPIDDGTVKGWNCTRDNNNIQLQAAATEAEPVVTPLLNGTTAGPEYDFYQEIVNAPVGVYDVRIGTRTASQVYNEEFIPYNGMDDETGLWDKYIYVQVDNEEPQMVPFSVGSGWTGYTTVVRGVEVKEGSVLRIGVVEHYVSQKAQKDGGSRDVWDTNTFFTDARLYFAAPLEGYDYGQAATAVESVEALKAAKAGVIYNVAGQQVDENYKGVVIKGNKKVLQQ